MEAHPLEEWIELYEKKTHNSFKPHPNFRLLFFPERGFCEVALEPKTQMVMVYQLCGDGRFWKCVIDSITAAVGFKHGGAICVRNIKPYIRFWGFHVVKAETLSDNTTVYYCENAQGSKARLAPAWKDENGYAYYVTWEVT